MHYRDTMRCEDAGPGKMRVVWGGPDAPPPTVVSNTRERPWAGHDSIPNNKIHEPVYLLAQPFLPPAPAKVLDAGCGSGYGSVLLTEWGYEAVGVDVDETTCEYARNYSGCRVECASLERLPFESGEFDAIVSVEAIEHVHDDAAMFREFHRVLKPGGVLYASTPIRGMWPMSPFHIREYLPAELEAALGAAGFGVKMLATPSMPAVMVAFGTAVAVATR